VFAVGVDKVVVAMRRGRRQLSVSSITIARLIGEPDRIVILSPCVYWPQFIAVVLMLLMLLLLMMILMVLIVVLILVDMFTTV